VAFSDRCNKVEYVQLSRFHQANSWATLVTMSRKTPRQKKALCQEGSEWISGRLANSSAYCACTRTSWQYFVIQKTYVCEYGNGTIVFLLFLWNFLLFSFTLEIFLLYAANHTDNQNVSV